MAAARRDHAHSNVNRPRYDLSHRNADTWWQVTSEPALRASTAVNNSLIQVAYPVAISETTRMSERRQANRRKSFLRGCIYFNKRRSVIDCLVRDISPTGARLILSEAASVPDVVELHIPQKEETLRARIQWRTDGEIGVVFGSEAEEKAAAGLTKRIERLEAELAALKRMVRRLKSEVAGKDEAA